MTEKPKPIQDEILLEDFRQSWEQIRHVEDERWTITQFYIGITIGVFSAISVITEIYSKNISSPFLPETLNILSYIFLILGSIVLLMFGRLRLAFIEHMTDLHDIRAFLSISKNTNPYVSKKVPHLLRPSLHLFASFLVLFMTLGFSYGLQYIKKPISLIDWLCDPGWYFLIVLIGFFQCIIYIIYFVIRATATRDYILKTNLEVGVLV